MAQIKLAEYTFDNSVGDCLPTLTPNTITMTKEDSISGTITTRIVYINDSTLPTQISFKDQTSLLTVDYLRIDSNITSMVYMFNECSLLTSVNTEDWDTSNVTSMANMFRWCKALTTLDLSSFNTRNVTDMSSTFITCSSLTSLNLTSFNTQNITTMDYTFYGCTSLTTLDLTSFNTQNVTSAFNIFYYWTSSQTIYISSIKWTISLSKYDLKCERIAPFTHTLARYTFDNTVADCLPTITGATTDQWSYDDTTDGNITTRTIGTDEELTITQYSFSGCSSLLTVDYLRIDSNIITMKQMFYGCSKLTSLDVSNFNTQNVTDMYAMFRNCSKLTSLNLSSFNTQNVTTMSLMFEGCSSLTSLDLSNFNTQNVTDSGNMFNDWTSNQTVHVSNSTWTIDVSSYNATFILIFLHTLTTYTFDNTVADCLPTITGATTSQWGYTDIVDGNITTRTIGTDEELKITKYGFDSCSSLLTVDYLRIDSNINIMNSFFKGCSLLTSVNTNGWDTSNVRDMALAFYNCPLLTTLDTAKWNTSNVTSMYFAFTNCRALPSLNTSSWNTSKVTTMASMFSGCSSLTSLDVSNWDVSNVANIGSMFNGCSSLLSLNAPNWCLNKTNSINSMFSGCSSLTSLNISNWDVSNVANIGSMFYNCSKLTSLDLSGWDVSKVTDMRQTFYTCTSLTSLNVGNWDTSNVTNMYYLFGGCSKIAFLDLSSWNTSKATNTNGIFNSWTSSQTVYIFPNRWTLDTSSLTPTFIYKYDHLLAKYTFDNSVADCLPTVTGIDESQLGYFDEVADTITTRRLVADGELNVTQYSFRNKTSLLTLDYLKINSDINTLANLCDGCNKLTKINSSDWDTSNVTNMNAMLYNCYVLTTLDVSNWNTNTLTQLTNAFYNCKKLPNLTLTNWNTENLENSDFAFYNCSTFTSLDLSSWNTPKLKNISGMFGACSSLLSLNISNWDVSNITNMSSLFVDCTSLKDIVITDWNVSNVTNMTMMFYNCRALTSLDLSNWNVSNVTNMTMMFYNCSSLTILDLSNFDMANVTTNTDMFMNCTQLADVGMIYCDTNTVNTVATLLGSTTPVNIYYFDAEEKDLTVVDNIAYNKYVFNTVQLPPHIEMYSVGDVRDELDLKTGTLIRRVRIDENNQPHVLEEEILEQIIINYENSCDYGRVLPTGTCDKYDVVNSVYTQTMTSILLDGVNTWDSAEILTNVVKFTATGTTVGVEELNMLGAGGLYCDNDLFPNINDDSDVEHCRVDIEGNKFHFYVSIDRLLSPDLVGWQIWLQENPFNMIYEMVEYLKYEKPYDELDATQARWEEMGCANKSVATYINKSPDKNPLYPTFEYSMPSLNNFEAPMLEPNTEYTIYAEGINEGDTINFGGSDIEFKNATVFTSGENQWLRIDNNDTFYNMVITKGDTTGEVVPYFEGMTSVENPSIQCGESKVSYTDLKLRSLPNGVKDTINVVTGEYVQRIGEREYQDGDLTNIEVLTDGVTTTYGLEEPIVTQLDAQELLAYKGETINLSSDTGFLPTIHYTVPSTNVFYLPSMKTGTRYTLKYPTATGTITIGDIIYSINSASMLFTTPLKINGDKSAIIFSDDNPENVILIEGAYNTRETPYFTGLKSVKNPNIMTIDQLSTETHTYGCETDIVLRGLPNGVADTLDIIKGKLTTVVGVRGYQEGDEELDNVWTDGYTTAYALSTPVVTNVAFETPTVTTTGLINLASEELIPQLSYRALSTNNFPLNLLQPNSTYTLYADTLATGSYTLGGTHVGTYTKPHKITLGETTDNLLTFNGDLGLSNVMLVKGNSLNTTLPKYFSGLKSVTNASFLVEGANGEINALTMDNGIVLRDCNGVKDTIDLMTCVLTKNTGEITLNGSEAWYRDNNESTEDYNVFKLVLSGLKEALVVCDTLQSVFNSKEIDCVHTHTNTICITIANTTIGGNTVNNLKTWLNQNPTTVIYQLTTPIKVQMENVWTTTPPTSYEDQTSITTTTEDSLKPMLYVTIATTTLEEVVASLEAQNAQLEEENTATMLALTGVYETMVVPTIVSEATILNLSDGKDGNNMNGMSISPMGMIYAKLVKKGLRTIEQVPAHLQAEVKYVLKEDK